MAILHELQFVTGKDRLTPNVEYLNYIGELFWEWYENGGKNRLIRRVSFFGIFKKTIYVKDIKDILIVFFGPPNGLSKAS